MPKEKRNNLAIYTLAGSILISSVLVSMNQANAYRTLKTKEMSEYIRQLDSCLYQIKRYDSSLYETTACDFLGQTRF